MKVSDFIKHGSPGVRPWYSLAVGNECYHVFYTSRGYTVSHFEVDILTGDSCFIGAYPGFRSVSDAKQWVISCLRGVSDQPLRGA